MLAQVGGAFQAMQVGLLLLALVGLAWAIRRRNAVRHPAARTIRLTPQHALHVVELDGRKLLVATGPSGAPRLLDSEPLAELDLVGRRLQVAEAGRP